MQGWAPDFVSDLTQKAVDEQLIDQVMPVAGDAALSIAQRLAREEGIFVGTSGGATLAAALQVAAGAKAGSNIVCMLPDTGERYMSTPLFEEIGVEMDDTELALSRSTPSCRFDVDTVSAVTPVRNLAQPQNPEVEAFVTDVLNKEAVVLFALEWCEFSWSVRKLFSRLGVDYRSIDLDSVAFQENDRGGKIRAVLAARTGATTIPQVFIGGRYVGGCTELFDGIRDGSVQVMLDANGVTFDHGVQIDPYELLPRWVQPRKFA